MKRLRRPAARRFTSLAMSLVVMLLLACQGMAMASTPDTGSVHKSTVMAAMPGCHLMQSMAKTPSASDSDCQHIVKAFDNSGTAGLVWAYAPAGLPSWTTHAETTAGIPPSALPEHDPVVDPPPTLRLHRFLE